MAKSTKPKELVINTLQLVYDENCRALILGSMPGKESREHSAYYANPNNKFWKVLGRIFNDSVPNCYCLRNKYLLDHHIAVWDVCFICNMIASKDSSIKIDNDFVPNHICALLKHSQITDVFFNGSKAEELFYAVINNWCCKSNCRSNCINRTIKFHSLASSSSRTKLDKLVKEWKEIADISKDKKTDTPSQQYDDSEE